VHFEIGNNMLLAKALGLSNVHPILPLKGQPVGLMGVADVSREALADRLTAATGAQSKLLGAGPSRCRHVAVVTGGAGGELGKIAELGADTFVTGEAPHWAATAAEDCKINLLLGGHYATETFGVRALAERMALQFELEWEFLDHPTGL